VTDGRSIPSDLVTPRDPASAAFAGGSTPGWPGDVGICTGCGAPFLPRDRYCEACGATLPKLDAEACVTCRSCGGPVDTDGYCTVCGVLDDAGPCPEHEEIDLGWVAAVTDRGHRHHANEDAVAVATVAETMMAVVCDGVSSTPGSAVASRGAADAALIALHRVVGDADDWADGMREALEAARAAASASPAPDPSNPPACTIVAAVAGSRRVVIGWLGDSRAYWLDASGGQRLTRDDSWGAERVTTGVMTDEVPDVDRRAHLITRWLGADAPVGDPHVIEFESPGTGMLILCSDGLWNYGPSPEVLAQHASGAAGEAARGLCEFALSNGGQDNVTVVVARFAKEAGDDVSP